MYKACSDYNCGWCYRKNSIYQNGCAGIENCIYWKENSDIIKFNNVEEDPIKIEEKEKVMKDGFGTELKIGDRITHFQSGRAYVCVYTGYITGFTKKMVKYTHGLAYPHKVVINNDPRFPEKNGMYL